MVASLQPPSLCGDVISRQGVGRARGWWSAVLRQDLVLPRVVLLWTESLARAIAANWWSALLLAFASSEATLLSIVFHHFGTFPSTVKSSSQPTRWVGCRGWCRCSAVWESDVKCSLPPPPPGLQYNRTAVVGECKGASAVLPLRFRRRWWELVVLCKPAGPPLSPPALSLLYAGSRAIVLMLVFRRDMDVSNHSNWQCLRTEMRYTRTHHFHLQMKVWLSELEPSPYLGTRWTGNVEEV